MKIFALPAAAVLLAASSPLWLDAPVPAGWNVAGASVPAAPGPRDAELAHGGRCASTVRPSSTPEDREVNAKGWYLIGPYARFGAISSVMGTANADGMCRPEAYQAFVFVNGAFAGTVSPHPMDSRTDGSLSGSLNLFSATDVTAQFERYDEKDALCCPHATTTVVYKIETKNGHALLVPTSTDTYKNASS